MTLGRLEVRNIRNIESASLELGPAVNVIVGANGSGKTSILESVYFLGSARTFRGAGVDQLIRRGSDDCLVKGRLSSGADMAVQRDRSGSRQLRLSGQPANRTSQLAQCLPVLVLGPDTISLVSGAPDLRRRFLNWGVFHVEHDAGRATFQQLWDDATRCLRQRNEVLRQPSPDLTELSVWTKELALHSETIDRLRSKHMGMLAARYLENCQALTDIDGLSLEYQRGWDSDGSLEDILSADVQKDIKRGYTQKGFQRADVKIRVSGDDVGRSCSRGELKALAWILTMSQGELLSSDLIYLVDDLLSELDGEYQSRMCRYLAARNRQMLVTGIDEGLILRPWEGADPAVFHVKHGVVEESLDE